MSKATVILSNRIQQLVQNTINMNKSTSAQEDACASTPQQTAETAASSTSTKEAAAEFESTSAENPSPVYEPPPPYLSVPSSLPNPGFCDNAFLERQNNRIPNGGMKVEEYALPCSACGVVCGTEIPAVYKTGWMGWIDPSVNFRWESHTGVAVMDGQKRELLGCWICWEYDGNWVKPMFADEWYMHTRKHFKVDGYKACKGKIDAMQRRRNCPIGNCPKIHS